MLDMGFHKENFPIGGKFYEGEGELSRGNFTLIDTILVLNYFYLSYVLFLNSILHEEIIRGNFLWAAFSVFVFPVKNFPGMEDFKRNPEKQLEIIVLFK